MKYTLLTNRCLKEYSSRESYILLACAPGFYGIFCNTSCIPGRYGAKCGGKCFPMCSYEDCDPVNGCQHKIKNITQRTVSGMKV